MTTQIEQLVSILPSATGTIDYRCPAMANVTPNGVMITTSRVTSAIASVVQSDVKYSFGVGSKLNGEITQGVINMSSDDSEAASVANSYYNTSNVVNLPDPTGTVVHARATLVDFLTDNGSGGGVRLNFTSLNSNAYGAHISLTFFYCPHAYAGNFTAPGSIGGTATETFGFQMDAGIFLSVCCASPVGELMFSVGAATNDLTQYCNVISEVDAVSPTQLESYVADNRAMVYISGGAVSSSQELTAVSGTGFTMTQRDGTDTPVIIYLALDLGNSSAAIVPIDSRTTAGTQTVTTGFRPQYVFMPTSNAEAYDTVYTNANAGSLSLNMLSGPFDYILAPTYQPTNFSLGVAMEDAVVTTNTNSAISAFAYGMGGVEDYGIMLYDDTAVVVTAMTWADTRTGFTLDHTTGTGTTKKWWALAFEVDVPSETIVIKRMYSLLHGLALSFVVGPSNLTYAKNRTVDDLAFRMTSYTHEIGADGGYLSAQLGFVASRDEIMEWIDNGVGRQLTVYNEGQEICWLGVIESVDATIGGISFNSGSLLDVSNRISVAYRRKHYDIIGGIGGQERITAEANDEASQELFGIMQAIINGGESTSVAAEQLRDAFLEEISHLSPTETIAFSGGNDLSITLNCVGYYVLLDKFLYDNSSSGEVDADTKIADILDADPNSIFYSASGDIEANTYQVPDEDDGQITGLSAIRNIVAYGDASNNRWIAGSLLNRRFYYRAIPNVPETVLHLSDAGNSLRTKDGRLIRPWNAVGGDWFIVPDLSLSRAFPFRLGSKRGDTRTTFIERVQYTAPYGLQISGGRYGTINQRLAKLGLGGV